MNSLSLVFFLGFAALAWADPAADGSAAPAPPAADGSALSEDDLWAKIGTDGQQISQAEKGTDKEAMKPAVLQIKADLADYLKRFPAGAHVPEAKIMEVRADQLTIVLNLPGAPTSESVNQRFDALATDTSMPTNVRVQASMAIGQQIFAGAMEALNKDPNDPAVWDNLEGKIEAFEKHAGPKPGQEPEQAVMVFRENQILLMRQANQTERLQKLLAKLQKSSIPELAALAKQSAVQEQQAEKLKSMPLDLKFTALDGSSVDVSKLRGKVVLVDFWATWCQPCVAEMPQVVAAYEKYHGVGLEIVGISLDQDKDALQKYLGDNKMPWPQYFDGKGWDNLFAKRFGIDSIPAMWLVGKDGKVVTMDAGGDLDANIGKLLLLTPTPPATP
jgi:thiol-disulfide isomerase/thioredoxin